MIDINLCEAGLQLYDMRIIDKERLSKIMKLNFENGEWNSDWYNIPKIERIQILSQLYDKQIISDKILVKNSFNIDI